MRRMRILAAATALIMNVALVGTTSAAPAAITFHGTFQGGLAISAGAGGVVQFGLPLSGDWNVNINTVTGKTAATFVVRYAEGDAMFGFPEAGLHILWTPCTGLDHDRVLCMDLETLTQADPILNAIPDAAGIVNDPDHGVYAVSQTFPWSTLVAVVDVEAGTFFYAGAANPGFQCPADDVYCFDSVEVWGTIGH